MRFLFSQPNMIVRWLGQQDYLSCWQAMQKFTTERHADTPDEIWLLEHNPVFTQGQNGKAEHVLTAGVAGDIPIVKTDRGGQITYHGPGQLIVYTLIDLKRQQLNIREFVTLLENTIIEFLNPYTTQAYAKCKAPGVYVKDTKTAEEEHKICSIGLRIRRGCAYHGIAFNVDMDLTPFSQINPCGFPQLKMTQLAHLGGGSDILATAQQLFPYLLKRLQVN
ncbi:MAG TPA: lipoyl(octanoyl) transferase LipB [Gammaproteobacteria bacterium]|jgi:lipoyl(octanoyl) transferase|nr:lipoyl(octanoyl) transferase LipB [Gammaproteobacteria bacterium]